MKSPSVNLIFVNPLARAVGSFLFCVPDRPERQCSVADFLMNQVKRAYVLAAGIASIHRKNAAVLVVGLGNGIQHYCVIQVFVNWNRCHDFSIGWGKGIVT